MAKAIFHKEFNFTPKGEGISWRVEPLKAAQSFPQRVIDAAVKEGAAKAAPPKKAVKTK